MDIKINAVNFTPDQKLIDFVKRKVGKLDTFFEGIIGSEVTLKVLKPETANNKISEVKLSIPRKDSLFAKKQADSFEQGIDLAVDAVRKQLTKYKEKLRNK